MSTKTTNQQGDASRVFETADGDYQCGFCYDPAEFGDMASAPVSTGDRCSVCSAEYSSLAGYWVGGTNDKA